MARKPDPEKKQRIIEAAFTLFGQAGFRNTSMNDIAREAGIATGSLYTYFPDKEILFEETINHGWDEVIQEISANLAAPGDFLVRFNDFLTYAMSFIHKAYPLIRSSFSDYQRTSLVKNNIDRLSQALESFFSEGISLGLVNLPRDRQERLADIRYLVSGIFTVVSIADEAELDTELTLARNWFIRHITQMRE